MIIEKYSIIEAKTDYIIQWCHCVGNKLSPINKIIVKEYPFSNPYSNKEETTNIRKSDNKRIFPGNVEYITQEGMPIIINLYGQFYMGSKNCDQDNPTLRMKWLKKALNQINKDIPSDKTIALPHKIGCITEGGDWKKYEKMF